MRYFFRQLLLVLVALLVAGLCVGAAALLWRAKVDRDLDAYRRRSLGETSLLEQYPKAGDNSTVHEMEWLGAEIGIGFVSVSPEQGEQGEGNDPSRSEAVARSRAMFGAVKDFQETLGDNSEDSLGVPPAEVRAFLDSARPTLDRLVEILLHRPKAVWRRDLSLGFEGPIPNYLGALSLQRLLLLEAHERLRAGESARASDVLEAAWRLFEAVRDENPFVLTQRMAQVQLQALQPVLRQLPPGQLSRWRPRLSGLDLRERALLALQAECSESYVTALRPPAIEGKPLPEPGRLQRWLVHWWIKDYSRRCYRMIEGAAARDIRGFDSDEYYQEQLARIPRWQFVARTQLSNSLALWPEAARRELDAELTLLVLQERERLAKGGPAPARNRRPSRVKGLAWIYQETPEAIAIRLDGDLRQKEEKPAPLRYVLRTSRVPSDVAQRASSSLDGI